MAPPEPDGSSAERSTRPLGEPMTRSAAPPTSVRARPGHASASPRCVGGTVHETRPATRRSTVCPALLHDARGERLGRPGRPVARAGGGGRRRARAAPAHRRGRPRGQPAGQDRDDRRRRPHRAVRSSTTTASPSWRRRSTSCSGHGFLLTAHDADLGPAQPRTTCAPASRPILEPRPGPPAVGARRRHRRRLLPVRGPARRRHRRGPGRGHPRAPTRRRWSACSPQARAHRGAPRGQPGPRGLQPADEPGHAARSTRTSSSTSATSTTTSSG